MCRNRAALLLTAAVCLMLAQTSGPRFKVPEGFAVETVLTPEETGSLIALTFDSLGRPVISKERAHPTTVIGKEQKPFTDKVTHAQGMWFDGRTLYAIGNGPDGKAGLYRAADTNADDVADTFESLLLFTGPMGEHGPHDIRRGPDGRPTLLLGNHTGIPRENIDPNSPLRGHKESQLLERYMDARGHAVNVWAPGATIWRADLERNRYTLLSGGFRNPYDHAFNLEGEVFTFDSDMEWDINLPWYREVRSVHAVPGGDYGWRTGSGKFPDYYLDSLPPLREVGRGSPVGVEFYQHYIYPKEYFDAYLEGDWSRGRILWTGLARLGATYRATLPPTDFVYGEPLNVTDLEVGPDGFVYFVNGGRDTEGGLYRVTYRNPAPAPQHASLALAAVRQPQPLSSWGHAALLELQKKMGDSWGSELEKLARDTTAASQDRVQALHLLQRLTPRPRATLLDPLSQDRDEAVRAAAIYVVGQHGSPAAKAIAARGLKDASPFVRRRACEALVRMGIDLAPVEDVYALLRDPDRYVRYAARVALERIPREKWEALALTETDPTAAPEALLALTNTGYDRAVLYRKEIEWLKRPDLRADDTLRFLRAFHLTALAGEIPPSALFQAAPVQTDPGAPADVRRQAAEILLPRFPAGDERLNREYARTLAYCDEPRAIAKILAAMPPGNENQPLQIHYVYCLRAIRQGWTPQQKRALVAWFEKAERWRGGASFPGFINNLFNSALASFSEEEKKYAYERIPAYAPLDKPVVGRAGHVVAPVLTRRGRSTRNVSEQEILEYMLYDPMILRARPERGKAVYEKACAACHRFGDIGTDYGPDLTTIASRFKRKDIIEATLWPSKTVSDLYAAVEITTTGGQKHLGTVAAEDASQVTLQIMGVGQRVSIPKKDIRSRQVSKASTMPEGLLDGFAMNEIADLFAYLQGGTGR
jgi:putative heme-binding domain-containing protein